MDMDLWWCPVCERAITEQEEIPPRPTLLKRASLPPSKPRYTSRGGVYGPKGSLYCSEACRQVEETNGRFAFQQLAACLPDFIEGSSYVDEPESESTLSGTDEAQTDRSRSLSLGRRSASIATSERTSASSPVGVNLSSVTKPKGLLPLTPQRDSTKDQNHVIAGGLTTRRVPILLSPNGTPLVQPIFPQRPGLGPHQRRHHSQYNTPQKRCSPHTTVTTTGNILTGKVKIGRLMGHSSNSVPTPSQASASKSSDEARAKIILNHQSTEKNDMEFEPEARLEKPTYLWQHYGLFYRSRPGSIRGEWAECTTATELDYPYGLFESPDKRSTASIRRTSPTGSQKSSPQTLKRNQSGKSDPKKSDVKTYQDENRQRLAPLRASSMTAAGLSKQDWEHLVGHHRKDRKTEILEESKCCRSWSWDHLPADVPQYPAMDLEQIRLSKMIREQKLDQAEGPEHLNGLSQRALTCEKLSFNSSATLKVPVQTKKKLFIFN